MFCQLSPTGKQGNFPTSQVDEWNKRTEIEVPPRLTGGALRMLKVLVSRYPMKLTKSQLGTFAKMKPRGGSFGTYLSTLKSAEYIVTDGDLLQASQYGIDSLGEAPNPPQTTAEVLDMWRSNLTGGAKRMFEELVVVYPQKIAKSQLGELVGMSAAGGSFGTYLSILKSNGLIEVKYDGVKLSDNLFI